MNEFQVFFIPETHSIWLNRHYKQQVAFSTYKMYIFLTNWVHLAVFSMYLHIYVFIAPILMPLAEWVFSSLSYMFRCISTHLPSIDKNRFWVESLLNITRKSSERDTTHKQINKTANHIADRTINTEVNHELCGLLAVSDSSRCALVGVTS